MVVRIGHRNRGNGESGIPESGNYRLDSIRMSRDSIPLNNPGNEGRSLGVSIRDRNNYEMCWGLWRFKFRNQINI